MGLDILVNLAVTIVLVGVAVAVAAVEAAAAPAPAPAPGVAGAVNMLKVLYKVLLHRFISSGLKGYCKGVCILRVIAVFCRVL